jgi:Holliday junction resolvasome RuvABC endonuclease subunit
MKPTTPLLPPYPTPLYSSIDELIEQIWEESMALEEEFYKNNSETVMLQFTMNVLKIQYWETVSLRMQQKALR